MIFLRARRGQAAIEALGSLLIMFLLLLVGTLLILNAFGSVILNRWASKMSHCVAEGGGTQLCTVEITQSLTRILAFKDVHVLSRTRRGIVHSEITAHLFERSPLWFTGKFERIVGTYDLEPSEYKRVP